MVPVFVAVEGLLDEAVAERVVRFVGAEPGPVFGKEGKSWLLKKLERYTCAARFAPWFVLVDLDQEAGCAPPFRAQVLPSPAPLMCFRVAVRMVEAWLLADQHNFARFLGIPSSSVPAAPEALADPKQEVVRLTRSSGKRDIRQDLVPRAAPSARVGPAYASWLGEFVVQHREPGSARKRAPSLDRAIQYLENLVRRRL